MKTTSIKLPWQHWVTDDFLSLECLAEVKQVKHVVNQSSYGVRNGSNRLFITDEHASEYPHLHALYKSLHIGEYKEFFESYTGLDYTGLHPRVEVVSDYGEFFLKPHHDHLEKRLTALVYTNYEQLYPGTMLSDNSRIESKDNRCFFFVPNTDTYHSYPATTFNTVRRCLQINYWTYSI
jgi:hypothetical protein